MNAGPGPLTLDLSLGTPDPDLLPDLGPALARVAGRPLPQGYLVDPVLPELAERLRDRWPFSPGHLSVVDGAMDALDRLTALTVRLGDVVLVEEAAFPPVLDLLDTVGAEVVPVAMDDEGMVPDALRAALARRPVAVYVQPRAHNPLGVSVTEARAAALAKLLEPTGAWVFEDDHAGDIATSPLVSVGTHLPARTVLVQSFSKSFGPDLRLAAVGGAGGPGRRAGGPPAPRGRLVQPSAAGGAAGAAGRPRPPPRRCRALATPYAGASPAAGRRTGGGGRGDDRP